jgi:hypothetical protein
MNLRAFDPKRAVFSLPEVMHWLIEVSFAAAGCLDEEKVVCPREREAL